MTATIATSGCGTIHRRENRNYAWENFITGNQVLFMDPYLVYYPRQKRNMCISPVHGIGSAPDPRWENFRDNLGYLLRYSRKLNLANVAPREHSLFDTAIASPRRRPSARSTWFTLLPAARSRWTFRRCQARGSWRSNGSTRRRERRSRRVRFPPDHPRNRSLRRSAAMPCSTWWIRRDTDERIFVRILDWPGSSRSEAS